MKIPIVKSVLTVTAGMVLALGISATSSAIDKGGTLNFVVASKICLLYTSDAADE